jgi:hypothetical protein
MTFGDTNEPTSQSVKDFSPLVPIGAKKFGKHSALRAADSTFELRNLIQKCVTWLNCVLIGMKFAVFMLKFFLIRELYVIMLHKFSSKLRITAV